MGILKAIFSSKGQNTQSNNQAFNWIILDSALQLAAVKKASYNKTCVVFKHSTRCGTSRMVLKSFEKKWAATENVNFYYLDLLRYRNISDTLAHDFEVFHQSPQLIVIEEGKVMAADSHYSILEMSF